MMTPSKFRVAHRHLTRVAAGAEYRAEVVAQVNGAMVNLFAVLPTDDPTVIEGYELAEPMERPTPESRRLEKDAKKVLAIFRKAMGIRNFDSVDLAGPHQWVHSGEDVTRMTVLVYKKGYKHDRRQMADAIADAVKRLGYRITRKAP